MNKEQTLAFTAKNPQARPCVCICATIRRAKRNKPKRYIFDTPIQSFVENAMYDLGYGSDQYWLSFVDVNFTIQT